MWKQCLVTEEIMGNSERHKENTIYSAFNHPDLKLKYICKHFLILLTILQFHFKWPCNITSYGCATVDQVNSLLDTQYTTKFLLL